MARNIQARRKLSDLYRTGTEVRFGPDGGRIGRLEAPYFDEPAGEDEVVVFIRPPSPLQRNQAMSEAQAARARAMIRAKRDEDSEEYLTALNFVTDMSLETLLDYVLLADQEERKNEAIRDVLGEEEWKDFTTLQDAMRQFDEDETPEDDPEYAGILERDREYGRQVNERFQAITEGARESLKLLSRATLEKRAMDKRAELIGSQRFMEAFETYMSYYSVRDVDAQDVLFFDSPREFQEADDLVQQTIKDAIAKFIDDPGIPKNSQGAASGSDSSVPPNAPETSEASIPEAVNA